MVSVAVFFEGRGVSSDTVSGINDILQDMEGLTVAAWVTVIVMVIVIVATVVVLGNGAT